MTPTQTEAHTEGYAEIQASPGGILARINVGALLQFEGVGFPGAYAVAAVVPEYGPIVLVSSRPEHGAERNASFEVTAYTYNGQNQAKISLRSRTLPAGFWAPGKSPQKLPNPIVIADRPGVFLLTDTGRGNISIQNTFSPPSPYIRCEMTGDWPYLKYGFDADPREVRGLFRISIVG
ncbi:MAG TPA: hypothetical protein VGS07_30990 [Thermoanaerobaculia bacterium]|jgi:hypothetical protein|nr:hypothetical protein [Thermoanaerobaculia bacterium]